MHLVGLDDNTKIVLLAVVAGIPSWLTLIGTMIVRKKINTPSGAPIGQVAEETHAIAHANSLGIIQIHQKVVNGEDQS